MRKQALSPKKIYQTLLSYMVPGIAGLLFNSLYIVVDGLFVARMLGREPLAAVTVGVPVIEILLALSMLISVGAGVLISQNKGRGALGQARRVFNLSVYLLAFVSLVTGVSALLFIKPLAKWLGASPDILGLVTTYLSWFFMFSPAFMFSYAMCTWLRNDSSPRRAMVAQIVGALSNVFLDWLFMGPLNMGIAGAAIATGLGPLFSIVIMLPHFTGRKGTLYFEKTKMDAKTVVDLLLKGLPAFTMEFSLGMTTLCVNLAIGIHLGALGFATFGILGYIALLVLSVFLGMAEGSQPLISYYHGAGDRTTIRRLLAISLCMTCLIGLATYLFLFKFAQAPVFVFAGDDRELAQTAVLTAKYYFPALFASGINIILASYMQSIGRWKGSVLISLSRSVLILLPLLLMLPRHIGEMGIWISVPLAELLTLPVAYGIRASESGKKKGLLVSKERA